MEHQPAVA
jgi:hypothetical protein